MHFPDKVRNMKNTRLKPAARREMILDAALKLAHKKHYLQISRDAIAAEAGITGTAVQYYYSTMPKLRRAIMRAAVKEENLKVILEGLIACEGAAISAPKELRDRAVASIGGGS